MELQLSDDSTVTLISDTGEYIAWNVSVFDRTRFTTVEDVFRDINGYWSRLTENRRARIFAVYMEIYNALDSIHDPARLAAELIGLVEKLYAEMPMSEVEHWVKFYGTIRLPETLKTEYDPDDPNPGRTYLKSDYLGLVILAVSLRPMVPVWGEYIRRIKGEAGSVYKEYAAMRLLSRSHLSSSVPMERLRLYIESSVQYGNNNTAAILAGLGSAELPEWLLSVVVVRRMAVGEIDAIDDRGSIISNIYGFVSNTLKDLDRKFGGGIKEKHPEDSGMEDEGSLLESYKVKQDLAAGDIVMFSVYTEEVLGMVCKIDETVPGDYISACVAHTHKLQELFIRQHHQTLCQWVMAKSMPPQSIPCLDKPALLRVMAATQSVLWHWGFPELAALVTADVAQMGKDMLLAVDSRSRIPAELVEELSALYPHGEREGDKLNPGLRKNNVASKAIAALVKEMSGSTWTLTCPPELIKQCQGVDNLHRMAIPPNVMEMLAKLVIKLARSNDVSPHTPTEVVDHQTGHG